MRAQTAQRHETNKTISMKSDENLLFGIDTVTKEFMQIEWKSQKGSPYLFKQIAEWLGVRVHRVRVMPGQVLEHTNPFHEVNVAISGNLTTKKLSATGKHIVTKDGGGNICITPAGQPISARWEKPLDNMGFSLDP